MRRRLLPVIGLLVTACSHLSGVVTVTDSWAPTTPPHAPTAVIYLTIDNGSGTDDQILDVASSRCGTVELHATTIDENRIMRMRLATPDLLEIPSGETLEMLPGGLHVMCIDPPTPFEEGETLDVTVTMEEAGTLQVTTPVENR
jgi:copper(I)-binding protein